MTSNQTNKVPLEIALKSAGILPVVTINRLDDAVPVAEALLEAGLPMLEVTLRSDCALAAIERIRREVPEAQVGAGTVLGPDDLTRCIESGASFAISPGASDDLYRAAAETATPWIPAVRTPTEVMTGLHFGHRLFKLFPTGVDAVGFLRSMRGPFPQVRFIPTGGVNEQRAEQFLKLPNVLAVGGSWMLPLSDVQSRNWAKIAEAARAAAELARASSL